MAKSKWEVTGAPVPLFERLIDEDMERKEEDPVKKTYTKQELKASIFKELSRILNTRCPLKQKIYEEIGPTLAGFGIPECFGTLDNGKIDAANSSHWVEIEKTIKKAIQTFEPRLANIQPNVKKFDTQKQVLSVVIYADMIIGTVLEPIEFPIDVVGFNEVDPS